MANNYFKFKQFIIYQDKTAMKVGVDSVLLGSWIHCTNAKSILDIGTGSGLLALMLAQKTNVPITALEIDENAYIQACENTKISKWNNINLIKTSIQSYAKSTEEKYDLIVCNPPYFHKSMMSDNAQRNKARHDNDLTINSLLYNVSLLISSNGSFYMIYPYERKEEVIDEAVKFNLKVKKLLCVKGTELKNPNRIILELCSNNSIVNNKINDEQESTIIIKDSKSNTYTEAYKDMTKDYYL